MRISKAIFPPYVIEHQLRGAVQKSPFSPVLRLLEGKAAYCLLRPEGRHLCFLRGAYELYVSTETWRERR